MRSISRTSALLLLVAGAIEARHGPHNHLEAIHRRHSHQHQLERSAAAEQDSSANNTLTKRGTCAFPSNLGLVSITPGSSNGGWAFAPDQCCTPGRFCPYACPPGQVSMQWDPTVLSYVYPGSRNGGLLCGPDGTVSKPFPNKPYCQSTGKNIGVQNNCGSVVSFCQTVLPGDEDMLIPTAVYDSATLAVPDTNYWASTAAHYYINPPGTSPEQACVWGSNSHPIGNWSPYVAGANADASGQVFIKLGWNPIYLEPATPFRNEMPNWGVKIDCPNGGCNGLPCAIDPSQNKVNEMVGGSSSGAGGGAFCVVTVPKGVQANFVVFNAGGSQSSGNQGAKFYNQAAASPTTTTSTTTTTTTTSTTTTSTTATSTTTTTTSTKGSTTSVANTTSSASNQTAAGYYGLANSTAITGAPLSTNKISASVTPTQSTSTSAANLASFALSNIFLAVFGLFIL